MPKERNSKPKYELPDVLPQLLPEGAERLGVDLAHVLPALAVEPGLVDEVLHLDEDAHVEPGRDAALLLGDDRLGLLVGLGQLLEARLHLVEVLDLLRVADRLHDVVQLLVPLLLRGPDDSPRVLLVVAELKRRKRIDISVIMFPNLKIIFKIDY